MPLVYQSSRKLEVERTSLLKHGMSELLGQLGNLNSCFMQWAGIVGLCEMRWKNFGEMSTDDGHEVYFSGEEDR